jgi:hypothetical protein
MTNDTYDALTLPITQGARRTALEFSQQQPTPTKADRVRLNTLAVLVTHDYLQLMDISTDLASGDSWNPVMQACSDVADLELPGLGRLECRPVLPTVDRCPVPAETWEDRVGYVVVQVDELAHEAQILGFVPAVANEELQLSELRSPEALLDHLYELRQAQTVPTNAILARAATGQGLTNLSNWLNTALQQGQAAIESGWQTVEQVFNSGELSPAYAFRRGSNTVRRAKRLSLGAVSIALVMDLRRDADSHIEIRLQLHPITTNTRLPNGLQLLVLDSTDAVVIDATATGAEDFLELQIAGATGETFRVEVRFNSYLETQAFVI